MMAEARLLRQHKGRLEARMQILEEHNRQLEAQLQRLRRLLDEVINHYIKLFFINIIQPLNTGPNCITDETFWMSLAYYSKIHFF